MTRTTVVKTDLTDRERQVVESLADGNTIAEVARTLVIRESTAASYLRMAKHKLGTGEGTRMLAVAYATKGIPVPEPLDRASLVLSDQQRELLLLIAQGVRAKRLASVLERGISTVRQDIRNLMTALKARSPVHLVKRGFQYRLLTVEQVRTWQ